MTECNRDVDEVSEFGIDAPSVPVLSFDPERYREHVKDLDLTEEQQTELLRTLWKIMSTMVDLSWGVDSVQQLLPAFNELTTQSLDSELGLNESPREVFNDSSGATKEGMTR